MKLCCFYLLRQLRPISISFIFYNFIIYTIVMCTHRTYIYHANYNNYFIFDNKLKGLFSNMYYLQLYIGSW